MKHITLILTLFITLAARAQSRNVVEQYVNDFKDIAMQEMLRTGVPASITLAQGIHESGAGKSPLVLRSNNHFGIKCKTGWQGEAVYHDDDERGECFRKYDDANQSYIDHSDFLKQRKHYAFLFDLDPLDYEGWAYGLKKAGYATNPKYPQILIKLINDYHLQDYTLIAMGKKPVENETFARIETAAPPKDVAAVPVVYPQGVFKINQTDVVFVPKGTSYLLVAETYNISLARLFEFNDLPQAEVAPVDGLIFLRRKRKHGASETYTVKGSETLHQIAQAEGLRLESLMEYNFLRPGMQPAVGEVLYLKDKAPAMPRLAVSKPYAQMVAKAQTPVESSSRETVILHNVQPKETVYGISKKYDVMADDILKWNNLDTSSLRTGQQLRILKKPADGTH